MVVIVVGKLTKRGLPVLRARITLCRVDTVSDGNQLRVGEIVGEGLSLSCGPAGSTGLPGIAQWHHVVDVNI